MNFLALCKRLRQEAGISGTGPATVTGQTGSMERVVDWIAAAYNDIQSRHSTWRFLRSDFSFATIATTQEYTPAAVSITDHAKWITDDLRNYTTSIGVSDERMLDSPEWGDFKLAYMFGPSRSLEERPVAVTVRPSNNALVFWPTPNAIYTVVGEYYTVPDVMTVDANSPTFPERFHMAIVWRALMLYGAYAAADEKYAHGQNEYRDLFRDLEQDQLDQLSFGEPLA